MKGIYVCEANLLPMLFIFNSWYADKRYWFRYKEGLRPDQPVESAVDGALRTLTTWCVPGGYDDELMVAI